jgi:peptidoglycan/xylan/chitin deacetylase (PgdA/CDA1 family)
MPSPESPKSLTIEEPITVTTSMRWFDWPSEARALEISCTIPEGLPGTPGAALFAFEFERPVMPDQLRGTGLSLSEAFGPFLYLQGEAGQTDFSATVRPGRENRLRRIGVRLWDHRDEFVIGSLRIADANPDQMFMVNLSIDVEALPHRAPANHVDRLIHGLDDTGRDHGIGAQMRLFREYNVPATFYLETGQAALYGSDTIRAVGRQIVDQGFDLQLHLHAEELIRAERWPWRLKGLEPGLENLNQLETRRVMNQAVDFYRSIVNETPKAFRAGSYQFNRHTVEAGAALGIKAFSNYRTDDPTDNTYDFPNDRPTEPFRWDNGVYEFPVTISPEPLSVLSPEVVWDRILGQVDVRGTWFVTIVIHSWSLLHRNAAGHLEWRNDGHADNLRRIIETAPARARFVSMAETVDALSSDRMQISPVRSADDLVRQKLPGAMSPAVAAIT